MIITKSFSVDFGPARSGLATVGYTLTGNARVSTGIVEVLVGSGIYTAWITTDSAFSGQVLWDTGGVGPVYAVEDVNPPILASNGLDAISVENGVNVRQALAPILAGSAGLLNCPAIGTPGTATLQSPSGITRATITVDGSGNRTGSTLSLPG